MKTAVLRFISLHLAGSYLGLFLGILVEGPGLTALGGFLARIGEMNIWMVFFVSVVGNFIPDVLFYAAGFWGWAWLIDGFGRRLHISRQKMGVVGRLYGEHPATTLLVVKLIPFLPPAGLAAAGAIRMPFGKYMSWSLAIIVATSGLFLGAGYCFGTAYSRIVHYQEYALAAFAVAIFLLADGYGKLSARIGKYLAPAELVRGE